MPQADVSDSSQTRASRLRGQGQHSEMGHLLLVVVESYCCDLTATVHALDGSDVTAAYCEVSFLTAS